jgi:ankyrin repeat protein
MVKFLVESGADKEAKDFIIKTPLHVAAETGHLDIVKFLVEKGADKEAKDNQDQTPLRWAEKAGEPSIVDYLKTVESSKRERFLFSF